MNITKWIVGRRKIFIGIQSMSMQGQQRRQYLEKG